MANNRIVYWNGKMIPESEARVSIYDSALMFGDTIFEMTRSFNKRHFKLREHLERLERSARYIDMPFPLSVDELIAAVDLVTEANEKHIGDTDEHRIMVNITRGLLPIYASSGVDVAPGPNVIIANYPLRWTVQSIGNLFDEGINVAIPSQRAIPARLLEPKLKNRSRIHYLKANLEIGKMKGNNNWALLLDEEGFVTEGIGSNFFIVKDNTILPPEPRNILRGVSRQYIFELAQQLNIPIVEKNLEPYDVLNADEAFMTATPFCMLPVTSFEDKSIGTGQRGQMFDKLINQWSENVGVNIISQIQNWRVDGINPYDVGKK